MVWSEGFRRLRLIARWLMLLGCPAGLILWLCVGFIAGVGLGLLDLAVLAGLPLMIGGMLLLFVWVLEGFFLRPDHPTSSLPQ